MIKMSFKQPSLIDTEPCISIQMFSGEATRIADDNEECTALHSPIVNRITPPPPHTHTQ